MWGIIRSENENILELKVAVQWVTPRTQISVQIQATFTSDSYPQSHSEKCLNNSSNLVTTASVLILAISVLTNQSFIRYSGLIA